MIFDKILPNRRTKVLSRISSGGNEFMSSRHSFEVFLRRHSGVIGQPWSRRDSQWFGKIEYHELHGISATAAFSLIFSQLFMGSSAGNTFECVKIFVFFAWLSVV